jgi:threonine dehydratase
MLFEPKDVVTEVRAAEKRIRPHIRETYLEYSTRYSGSGGAEVFLKMENLQYTGSFKVRGALNKILSLAPEQLARGVVTASTGNHGAAVAFALGKLGATGTVFVPETASPDKVTLVERLGATVRYHGNDCAEAEARARALAEESDLPYISPYNDPRVVGGQGTIGVELERQLDRIDAVFVSLGGGGLISGIAAYLKSRYPGVRIVGCSPENSQVMIQSQRAGEILDLPSKPTLSDGTAGGVEPGAITFELCRQLVDEYVTVCEADIAKNVADFTRVHSSKIEGAAAVAIAAYLNNRETYAGKNVVIVLCGANIAPDTLKALL